MGNTYNQITKGLLMKYVVIALAVIGFASFTTINSDVFAQMGKTIATQRGKNIPVRLLRDVTTHHWKLVPEKKEKKR